MIRRNPDGSLPDKVTLAEFCEVVRLEVSRFEMGMSGKGEDLEDMPFDSWDFIFSTWRMQIANSIRHRPVGTDEP
jgi:hypothetical protein